MGILGLLWKFPLMKRDRTAGFPGPWEPHTVHMYMHPPYRSVLGLDGGRVLRVKMMGVLGNGRSEGRHRGPSSWSDGRVDLHPGLTSNSWRGSFSAGRNRKVQPKVSNQESFMQEKSRQQDRKRREEQSWGGFWLGIPQLYGGQGL